MGKSVYSGKQIALAMSLLLFSPTMNAQQPRDPVIPPSYSIAVSVKEVKIAFEATDLNGSPILDLRPSEIDVFDNERGPDPVVSLQRSSSKALHVTFLIDVSGSVVSLLARSRQNAKEVVNTWIKDPSDKVSLSTFDRTSHPVLEWAFGPTNILRALEGSRGSAHPIGGTGIYDALFSSCFYAFASEKVGEGRNVIALFSDGEDTSSRIPLETALQACRKNNVAVYAFSPKPLGELSSLSVSTLHEVTDGTGGALLVPATSREAGRQRLDELSTAMRNGYILYFRPKTLTADGSFHRVVLVGPRRVAAIHGTPGYYAPAPPKSQ